MRGKFKGCKKAGFKTSDLLTVSILLSLLKEPSHGYSLLGKIKEVGLEMEDIPFGVLYRTLRLLEEEGLVTSEWQVEDVGPSKRIYEITEKGKEYLKNWVEVSKENIKLIFNLIERIEKELGNNQ